MLQSFHTINYWRVLFRQKIISLLYLKIWILGFFNSDMILFNLFMLKFKLLRNSFYVIISLFIVIIVHDCLNYMSWRVDISLIVRTSITDPKINSLFLASLAQRVAVFYIFWATMTFFIWFWYTKLNFTSRY